jgi:hypothetical protein
VEEDKAITKEWAKCRTKEEYRDNKEYLVKVIARDRTPTALDSYLQHREEEP